jgi:hypothetical protein
VTEARPPQQDHKRVRRRRNLPCRHGAKIPGAVGIAGVEGKPSLRPGARAPKYARHSPSALSHRNEDGPGGIGGEPVLDAKRERVPFPRNLPRVPPAPNGVKPPRRPDLGRKRYGGVRVPYREEQPLRPDRPGTVRQGNLGFLHDPAPSLVGGTDLGDGPAKNDFFSEKRPDILRVKKRKAAGGKGAAKGGYRERDGQGGTAKGKQEDGENEESRSDGDTARPRKQTEEEPEQKGEAKEQDGSQAPERMIHATDVATPVPARVTGEFPLTLPLR